MSTRTDYTALVEKINYKELEKKLEELGKQPPPKKKKSAADLLAPVLDKLRELHGKGWSYQQLADELKAMGCPIKTSVLREQLGKGSRRGRAKVKGAS